MGERKASGLISWVTSLAILSASVGAAWLLTHLRKEPERRPAAAGEQEVLTALVQDHSGGFPIEVDGLVVPYREIDLPAEVAGQIVEKAAVCRAGNFVTQGTVLYRIDPRDYRLAVERLEKELAQAETMLEELYEEVLGNQQLIQLAERDVELKKKEIERQERLRSLNSEAERERAQAASLQAENALQLLRNQNTLLAARKARLESGRDLVQVQLEQAQLDESRTEIRSPIDGMVVADLVEQGDYVQKGAVLVQLEDTSKAEIQCKLQMQDLFWIWNGHASGQSPTLEGGSYRLPPAENVTVVYRLAGLRDREYRWQARLDRFDGFGLDERTRTVPCRVVVDHPARPSEPGVPALLRGMYVSIQIHVEPQLQLLRVPARALRPGNQIWRVRDQVLDIVDVEFVRTLDQRGSQMGHGSGHGSGSSAEAARSDRSSPEPERPAASRPENNLNVPATSDPDVALVHVAGSGTLKAGDRVVVSPLPFVRSGMTVDVQSHESSNRP